MDIPLFYEIWLGRSVSVADQGYCNKVDTSVSTGVMVDLPLRGSILIYFFRFHWKRGTFIVQTKKVPKENCPPLLVQPVSFIVFYLVRF